MMDFKRCPICGHLTVPINGVQHCMCCGRDLGYQPEQVVAKSRFLYEQHRRITEQAHKNLLNNMDGSLDYCLRRGIKMGTILEWKLGYIPDNFSMLPISWWKRILFPIMSNDGTRIIAFGGRKTTVDDRAKYLNSANGPTYKKSESLYGYHRAPQGTSKMYLCEGYVDVLSMDTAGFSYPVASLGTALTPDQAMLIRKKAQNVVLCYDSDEAGQKNTIRAIGLLVSAGFSASDISVTVISGAKDVDEALTHGGTLCEESVVTYLSERGEYAQLVNVLM